MVEENAKALGDILTSENLDMMTGVLSETDIKILRNIGASGFSTRLGEDAAREKLGRIWEKLGGDPAEFQSFIQGRNQQRTGQGGRRPRAEAEAEFDRMFTND